MLELLFNSVSVFFAPIHLKKDEMHTEETPMVTLQYLVLYNIFRNQLHNVNWFEIEIEKSHYRDDQTVVQYVSL